MFVVQQTPSVVSNKQHINSSNEKRITINHIFSHNHNWDVYKLNKKLSNHVVEEVENATCSNRGYYLFECPECKEKIIHFGCNSRICTHCKHFTDKWAESIARKVFDVKHRHVVLMPDILWPIFYQNRNLLKLWILQSLQ